MFAGALLSLISVLVGVGVWAALLAALLGAFKEVYDHYTPGRVVDFWDFVATALPGIPVTIFFLV